VRVTDMRGIDLERFVFDTGLTLAVLWMNADGTIYHRYGGRDVRSADQWLSVPSMAAGMRASLEVHAKHQVVPSAASSSKDRTPLTLETVPSFMKRDKGECIHCHSVRPALYEEQLADKTWEPKMMWRFMPPSRVGIDLDRDEQRRITSIVSGSPAARSGLEVGDILLAMNDQSIATATDVIQALDDFDANGGALRVDFERGGEVETTHLDLAKDWKVGNAYEFSWRSFKWGLTPAPGFGGPQLDAAELAELGLVREDESLPFAFRVSYLVTWGDFKRYGQAAVESGLREGDVVVAVETAASDKNLMDDLTSVDHFHAWWRLTVKAGDLVSLTILRAGKEVQLKILAID
jgi:serine protease Do